MQLELFSPDRTTLGEAWEAVEHLDLDRARRLFQWVLERWPDTAEAVEALHWLDVAEGTLPELDGDPSAVAAGLWAAREAFPEGGLGGRFRRGVLGRLLWLMEETSLGGASETPCRGEVLLEMGSLGAAVRWLREAVETPGARHDLRWSLGEALWRLEKKAAARREWLRFFLGLEGEEVHEAVTRLPDPELRELLGVHGPEQAPLEAWLAGLAPLLGGDELPARAGPALDLHRCLLAAEAARKRGDLDGAVRHREILLREDPALLRRYMDRLSPP